MNVIYLRTDFEETALDLEDIYCYIHLWYYKPCNFVPLFYFNLIQQCIFFVRFYDEQEQQQKYLTYFLQNFLVQLGPMNKNWSSFSKAVYFLFFRQYYFMFPDGCGKIGRLEKSMP